MSKPILGEQLEESMKTISGWWCNVPILKNDGVRQWEGLHPIIPYHILWKNKFLVPNHQPAIFLNSGLCIARFDDNEKPDDDPPVTIFWCFQTWSTNTVISQLWIFGSCINDHGSEESIILDNLDHGSKHGNL